MANLNFPAVTDWVIFVETAPAGPGGTTFRFRVDIFVANSQQSFPLPVNNAEELSAIIGLLQIPVGRLLFNPATQGLIRTLV